MNPAKTAKMAAPQLYHPLISALMEGGHDLSNEDVDPCPNFLPQLIEFPFFKGNKNAKGPTPAPPTISCFAISAGIGLVGFTNGQLLRYTPSAAASRFTSIHIEPACPTPPPSVPFPAAGAPNTAGGLSLGKARGRKLRDNQGSTEIRAIFLSPRGYHALVATASGDVYYNALDSDVCISLAHLRGCPIRCVCWDTRNAPDSQTTREILLGTAHGTILSVVIAKGRTRVVRQLYAFSDHSPVNNIIVVSLPRPAAPPLSGSSSPSPAPSTRHGSTAPESFREQCSPPSVPSSVQVEAGVSTADSSSSCFRLLATMDFSIVVATAARLYQFSGGPTYEHAFQVTHRLERPPRRAAVDLEGPNSTSTSCPPCHSRETSSPNRETTSGDGNGFKPLGDTPYTDLKRAGLLASPTQLMMNRLLFEVPQGRGMTELHRTCVTRSSAFQQKEEISLHPQAGDPEEVKTGSRKCDPFLLWWLTGVGILVTVVTPPPSEALRREERFCRVSSPPVILPRAVVDERRENSAPGASLRALPSKGQLRLRACGNARTRLTPSPMSLASRNNQETWRRDYRRCLLLKDMSAGSKAACCVDPEDWCRSIAVTPYHLMVLQDARLVILSRITQKPVQTLSLPPVRYGTVQALVTDAETGEIYLVTSRYLFRCAAPAEKDCVWVQCLQAGDARAALGALSPSAKAFDPLCREWGNVLLRQKQRVVAAQLFSTCDTLPVEDLILQFLSYHHFDEAPLRTLLTGYLARAARRFPGHLTAAARRGLISASARLTEEPEERELASSPEAQARLRETFLLSLRLWILSETIIGLNRAEYAIETLKLAVKRDPYLGAPQLATDRTDGTTPRFSGSEDAHRRGFFTSRITAAIQKRKRLLDLCYTLMTTFSQHPGLSLREPLYDLCDTFGRPKEKLYWASVIQDQDMQVLETLCQGHCKEAISFLAQDPPTPFSPNDSSGEQQHQVSRSTYESGSTLTGESRITEWRARQLHLIAKLGPILFYREPARYAALLLRPDVVSETASPGLLQYLEERVREQPTLLDFLLPVFIPVAAIARQDAAFPNKGYTDVHTTEALRVVNFFLEILGSEASKASSSMDPVSNSLGKTTRCAYVGKAPAYGSWTGINGLWNVSAALLAARSGEEANLEPLLSRAMRLNSWPTIDIHFSLRLFLERHHNTAVLLLLIALGRYTDAVRAALSVNDLKTATLAVYNVGRDVWPPDIRRLGGEFLLEASDTETSDMSDALVVKRHLCRQIAQAGARQLSTPDLLKLLHNFNQVLRLHENFEFIPNPAVIGAYRDALCEAFDACEKRIGEKQAAINYNLKVLSDLKERLKLQRSVKIAEVNERSTCFFCLKALTLDRFYVFPCEHAAHALCIHRYKWPLMDPATQQRYREAVAALQDAMVVLTEDAKSVNPQMLPQILQSANPAISETVAQKWKQCERDVDAFLGDECPLCGNLLVKTITLPFCTSDELVPPDESLGKVTESTTCWIIADGPLPAQRGQNIT